MEVRNLKDIQPELLKQLKKLSFGRSGWMLDAINQILKGKVKPSVSVRLPHLKGESLSYNRGHAVIARSSTGDIMGWALVRHPSRRTKVPLMEYDFTKKVIIPSGKFAYAGRRSDFMVYVDSEYRRHRVARTLLLVAFNNFGRLTCFPHDIPSSEFYHRNRQFVVRQDARRLALRNLHAHEIFG